MTTTTPHSTIATSQAELDALLADLLPRQGQWSVEGYLWLTDETNRLIEFTDGFIEVLPMPTDKHQRILKYLFLAFHAFVQPRGVVQFAALRVRIRADAFREPDLLLLLDARDPRRENRYWTGADLVLEVVSPDKPARDLVEKRGDYARAGIPEYWIVDPQAETITVLRLDGGRYVEHGVFGRGARATSALLAGFAVAIDAVLDAD
ncbi:MAG TPA: Uma2 family endonuclease [Thermomicrobiales bacterium]|nr:Uma2 family endonuclease [Thermomicrobiales bacterium]